jgi:transposase
MVPAFARRSRLSSATARAPIGAFVAVAAKETGRPGHDLADLLKLYVHGYGNRLRSSRRLEAEAHRNIEVIWLLRRLKPDHRD